MSELYGKYIWNRNTFDYVVYLFAFFHLLVDFDDLLNDGVKILISTITNICCGLKTWFYKVVFAALFLFVSYNLIKKI